MMRMPSDITADPCDNRIASGSYMLADRDASARSDLSQTNEILENLLGWSELLQTTWCGSGGGSRYTILAPTNKVRIWCCPVSSSVQRGTNALYSLGGHDGSGNHEPSVGSTLEIYCMRTLLEWQCAAGLLHNVYIMVACSEFAMTCVDEFCASRATWVARFHCSVTPMVGIAT